jgi:hypothetical protein
MFMMYNKCMSWNNILQLIVGHKVYFLIKPNNICNKSTICFDDVKYYKVINIPMLKLYSMRWNCRQKRCILHYLIMQLRILNSLNNWTSVKEHNSKLDLCISLHATSMLDIISKHEEIRWIFVLPNIFYQFYLFC